MKGIPVNNTIDPKDGAIQPIKDIEHIKALLNYTTFIDQEAFKIHFGSIEAPDPELSIQL